MAIIEATVGVVVDSVAVVIVVFVVNAVSVQWWGGVHSHFRVQPNYSAEVVLCCVVVVVVTILYTVLLSQTRVNQCSSQLFHS